ncbi:ubiquitin-domain-containing protein [Xylariaceae sp. FL0594]|nr:ubiquitin-domain-containing protein [Xylariaceae sp. FL0594]
MADSAEGASADPQITFKVKTAGDRQHTITMPESATVAALKAKLAGSDFEDIPPERQRLIYSGRVLKNDETLASYKIKPGNTIHLVKSAASNPPPPQTSSSSASAPPAPQIPTNMAAGTANNPLAGLTGARFAGLTNLPSADMFGPDGGMVGSMMDEDQLINLLSNPHVAQQMNEMMNNDQFLDMMVQSNPMLRNNPNAREMLRSPLFRQIMTNPDALRNAAQLQRMLRGNVGQGSFPMPGITDTTPGASSGESNGNAANNSGGVQGQQPNPFGAFGMPNMAHLEQMLGLARNDRAANPSTEPTTGSQPGSNTSSSTGAGQGQQGASAQGAAESPPANPFASLFGGMGGLGSGLGGGLGGVPSTTPEGLQQLVQLLGMGGAGGTPAPADNRPPEERYAEQLRQLNDMGFFDFDRNVAALRRSGGSVQGAIEHLLNS